METSHIMQRLNDIKVRAEWFEDHPAAINSFVYLLQSSIFLRLPRYQQLQTLKCLQEDKIHYQSFALQLFMLVYPLSYRRKYLNQ